MGGEGRKEEMGGEFRERSGGRGVCQVRLIIRRFQIVLIYVFNFL